MVQSNYVEPDQMARTSESPVIDSEKFLSQQRKLLVMDSYCSKEKMLVIDLKKIQSNLYDKFCSVYNQFKFDRIRNNRTPQIERANVEAGGQKGMINEGDWSRKQVTNSKFSFELKNRVAIWLFR